MKTFKTISEIKEANKSIGNKWFDAGAMRFFNTTIESDILHGRCFITSEYMNEKYPKEYCIRMANDNGSIETIGQLCEYKSKDAAIDALNKFIAKSL